MRSIHILLLALVLTPVTAHADSPEATQAPHIIFILADDLTFRDLGPYGSPDVHTPNLDRLAAEGMRFDRCFQATAMCSPTRHNLYTGLYPVKSGAYPQATWVYPGTESIAHFLQPLGYRVALNGKRHVLPEESFPFDYLDEDTEPDLGLVETYLREAPDQPTCLFLCYRDPHTPWNKGDPSRYDAASLKLRPNFVDTPETRELLTRHYAEITWLDEQVGAVMALLDELGIADNTLLVFAGEQGNAFPFAKWTCYDDGLQSAFIARWPGVIEPGTHTEAMVEYVDIAPTFIDIAGGTPRTDLDGRSFLPVLRGETNHHKEVVYGIQTTRGVRNGSDHYGVRSARSEHYKYILNLTPEAAFANNVTVGKNKWFAFWPSWEKAVPADPHARTQVQRYQHRPAEELYDVHADPYELHNLATDPAYATIKADLRQRLDHWMQEQGDEGQATELAADQRNLKTETGRSNFPPE